MVILRKSKIEDMCRSAGMQPVHRDKIDGAEVFIADGLSVWPHQKFRSLGLGPDVFPAGAWVTLWWVSRGEDKLDGGSVIYCELFHDPQYPGSMKQRLRINAALADCRDFLTKRKQARKRPRVLH